MGTDPHILAMKKIEREKIIAKIQKYVSQNAAKIAALYIFGSFAKNEPFAFF